MSDIYLMILQEAPEGKLFRVVFFVLEEPDVNTLSKSNNFFPSFRLKITY